MHPIIALESEYVANNYTALPVVLVRGEGAHVWDDQGKRYLDMMSAYSAVSFGHGHARLVNALTDQAKRLSLVSRGYHTDQLAPLAKQLVALAGLDLMLPMNTGAEAVETAIKAARKWAYTKKGVPLDQAEIITCDWNFHGRTTTIVGFSTHEQYRQLFGPHTPGFVRVPFGDVAALEAAITPNTAAFLLEPVQGEGGIVVPPAGYLKAVETLCRKHNVLLIVDEVQTGLGRTGRNFAFQHENVRPDAVLLGKALGGGLLPVSAVVGTQELLGVFQPGDHGSTFGGNPLSCRVAREALALLVEEKFAERAAVLGAYLMEDLKSLNHPAIKQVRGLGLLVGVVLDESLVKAKDVVLRLLDRGILTKDTHGNVIRFAPPFVVSHAQLKSAVDTLAHVLNEAVPAPSQRKVA